MTEDQPSLNGFCDLGLKLESCLVTHQEDNVNSFLHPKAIFANNQTEVFLTGTLNNPVTAFLIPFFMTFCV